MVFGVLALVALGAVGVVFFRRHRDVAHRAGFVRASGFGLMAVSTAFFALFVIGETFSDPGGWAAVGLICAWLVPSVALGLFAWWRPDPAARVLVALTGLAIGLTVWAVVASDTWSSFENRNGPARTIAVFALTAVIAVLGLKKTRLAGFLLVALGLLPVALSALGGLRVGSLSVAAAPGLITGALYLWSARVDGRSSPPAPQTPDRLTRT